MYDNETIKITIPLIIIWAYIAILICREVWQLYKFKKRYALMLLNDGFVINPFT